MMKKENKTAFRVSFYHSLDDTKPHAIIPIEAKMPLGALAFALARLHLTTEMGSAIVEDGDKQWQYFHVKIEGSKIIYQTVKKRP